MNKIADELLEENGLQSSEANGNQGRKRSQEWHQFFESELLTITENKLPLREKIKALVSDLDKVL